MLPSICKYNTKSVGTFYLHVCQGKNNHGSSII